MDPFNDGDFAPTPSLEDPDVRRYLERQIDNEQFLERVLATKEAKNLPWCTLTNERNILELELAVDSSTSYPTTAEYGERYDSPSVDWCLMPKFPSHWFHPSRMGS